MNEVKTLKKFGWMMGAVIGPLFGLVFPWLRGRAIPYWPWVLSSLFLAFAWQYPIALKYPHKVWMKLAHVLAWINTRILLTVFFYLFLTPTAWIRRLMGKDASFHRFDRGLDSYREAGQNPVQFERPF